MRAAERLDRAVAILDGTVAVPADQRVLAAAHLARAGFEDAVSAALGRYATGLRRARMSSRLTVLAALVSPDLGATARLVWGGLSRVCHRHAFELQPSEGEVRRLIGAVRVLVSECPD